LDCRHWIAKGMRAALWIVPVVALAGCALKPSVAGTWRGEDNSDKDQGYIVQIFKDDGSYSIQTYYKPNVDAKPMVFAKGTWKQEAERMHITITESPFARNITDGLLGGVSDLAKALPFVPADASKEIDKAKNWKFEPSSAWQKIEFRDNDTMVLTSENDKKVQVLHRVK